MRYGPHIPAGQETVHGRVHVGMTAWTERHLGGCYCPLGRLKPAFRAYVVHMHNGAEMALIQSTLLQVHGTFRDEKGVRLCDRYVDSCSHVVIIACA